MSSRKLGQIKVVDVYRLSELDYDFGFDVGLAEDGRTPILTNVNSIYSDGQSSSSDWKQEECVARTTTYHYGKDRIRNGDILMEVSGVRVNSLSLDQIMKLLRCSGSRVLLKIQRSQLSIVAETCDRQSNVSFGDYDSLSEVNNSGGSVENGFTAATDSVLSPLEEVPTDLVSAAQRLAKRLYFLDGFKAGDVSRELCKRNRFSSIVVEYFMAYFDFYAVPLDQALRKYLLQFTLPGAVEELEGGRMEANVIDRERVLHFFCTRYIHCNPDAFNGSLDACYILVCSLLLLNTDLHRLRQEGIRHKKMTFSEFRKNLRSTEYGEKFDSAMLKSLYQSIKHDPLVTVEPMMDSTTTTTATQAQTNGDDKSYKTSCVSLRINRKQRAANNVLNAGGSSTLPLQAGSAGKRDGRLPALISSNSNNNLSFPIYVGWLERKCIFDEGGKRTSALKRQWVRLYTKLADLTLCFYRTENIAKETPVDCVQIQHSLASSIGIHKKRSNVFLLRLATNCVVTNPQMQLCLCRRQGAEYLFQAATESEMIKWVDNLNLTAALYSSPPLAPPVGSKDKAPEQSWIEEGFLFPATKSTSMPLHQRQWYWSQLMMLKAKLAEVVGSKEVESIINQEIYRNTVYVNRIDEYLESYTQCPNNSDCGGSQNSLLRLSGLCTLREDCSLNKSPTKDELKVEQPAPSSLLKRDAVVVASST